MCFSISQSTNLTHSSLAASKSPASAELALVPSSSISIAVSSPVAQPFPVAASPTPTPTPAPNPADAVKHASKRDAAFIDEVDEEARTDRNIGTEYAVGLMILLRSV
jgi:hypothetical protein